MADLAALLGDTLPYSLDGLLGLRAYFNDVVRPLPVLLPILLLVPLWPGRQGPWRRLQTWLVAACWFSSGLIYQLRFAAMLDWTAGYSAWLLVLQGALLVVHGLLASSRQLDESGSGLPGVTLMLLALIAAPLWQWLDGTPLSSIPPAGLDPGMTAMFTAGWLLAHGGRWWLWPLPLAWMAMEFAIGLGLGYIPPMLLLPASLIAMILHRRLSTGAEARRT